VSDLVIEDQRWACESGLVLAGESEADFLEAVTTSPRLIERLAACLAMTDDSSGAKLKTMGMDPVDLGQAHVLIRVPVADLGPRERLRDGRR
jgi:hypothetical protein